jgi:hypothetical protein
MFKKVLKKLGIISMLSVMVIGGFLFNGETKASAAYTIGGSPQCWGLMDELGISIPRNGVIMDTTKHWKYSQGTCWSYPLRYSEPVFGWTWTGDTNQFYNSMQFSIGNYSVADSAFLVYLERWDGANWNAVAHTGRFYNSMMPITQNSYYNGYGNQRVFFDRDYNGTELNEGGYYRVRLSNPTAAEWADTAFNSDSLQPPYSDPYPN